MRGSKRLEMIATMRTLAAAFTVNFQCVLNHLPVLSIITSFLTSKFQPLFIVSLLDSSIICGGCFAGTLFCFWRFLPAQIFPDIAFNLRLVIGRPS
jgi:hypothetical protein